MRAFTLVELAISVAIVATLAAIAIPTLHAMQMKARVAEVPPVVLGIDTALRAYASAGQPDTDIVAPSNPNAPLTGKPRPWATPTAWDGYGFRPDGGLRASYRLDGTGAGGEYAIASVTMDMDGDGRAVYAMGMIVLRGWSGDWSFDIVNIFDSTLGCNHPNVRTPWSQVGLCGAEVGSW